MKKNRGFIWLLWASVFYLMTVPVGPTLASALAVLTFTGAAILLETVRISRPAQKSGGN